MPEQTEDKEVWILTVDWCNRGLRGIFSSRSGAWFFSDEPITEEQIYGMLGMFILVLSPQPRKMLISEIRKRSLFIPLAEFRDQYGYMLTQEEVDVFNKKAEANNERQILRPS